MLKNMRSWDSVDGTETR